MDRNEFIKTSSLGCIGLVACGLLWSGCAGVRTLSLDAVDGQLRLKESDFHPERNPDKWLGYLIVVSKSMNNPIVVYRFSNAEYMAFLLQCTHQGTQLNVHGDLISCPAHGSEFNNNGQVMQGPATDPLKQFPIEVVNNQIIIHLV